MHTITTSLLVIAPILVLAQDARSCYWPNGTDVAVGNNSYFPCSSSGPSSCCLEGEACLSNGLCYGAEWGNTYRGACTDSTWTTSYCPQLCLAEGDSMFKLQLASRVNVGADKMNKGIWPWANIFNCESGQWWCGGSGSTWCKSGTNAFLYNWSHGTVLGIATNSSGVLASSKSTSTATAVSSSSTGSTAGSSSTASGDASAATATVTVTAAATTDDDKVSKSVPIGVGVGVGVPLALAAIAFAALWARERKKRIGAERSYSALPKNQINMEYGGPPHAPNETYDPPLHGRFAEADDGAGVAELAGYAKNGAT